MVLALYSIIFNVTNFPVADLADLIIMSVMFAYMAKIKCAKSELVLVAVILLIFSFNNYQSILLQKSIVVENVVFFYKWILPFLILSILKTFYSEEYRLRNLKVNLLYFSIILSIWTLLYTPLVFYGYIHGVFRPSYPFSNDFLVSDAHVLSSSLGILFVTFYFLENIRRKPMLLLLLFSALLSTGSRTGIIIVATMFCIELFRVVLAQLRRFTLKKQGLYIGVLVAVAFVIIFGVNIITIDLHFYKSLIFRSIDINFNDASADGRIAKFQTALEELSSSNFIYGPGFMAAEKTWYDGLLPTMLIHGGAVLVVILFLYFTMLIMTNRKNYPFLITLLCFVASNFITEHFLITRNILPTICCLWLLQRTGGNNKWSNKSLYYRL